MAKKKSGGNNNGIVNVHITQVGSDKIKDIDDFHKPITDVIDKLMSQLKGLPSGCFDETYGNEDVENVDDNGNVSNVGNNNSINLQNLANAITNNTNALINLTDAIKNGNFGIGNGGATVESAVDRFKRRFIDAGGKEKNINELIDKFESYDGLTSKDLEVFIKKNNLSGNKELLSQFKRVFKQQDSGGGKYKNYEIDRIGKRMQNFGSAVGGKTGDLISQAGKGVSKFATKAAPVLAIVDTIADVFNAVLKKVTEYARLQTENTIRSLNALTDSFVRSAKASLSSFQDAQKGAYETQSAAAQNALTIIQASNQNALASLKFTNSIWRDTVGKVPIIGGVVDTILGYQETALENEQKLQEARLQNALKTLETSQSYAQMADTYLAKFDKAIHEKQLAVGFSKEQTQAFSDAMLTQAPRLAEDFGKSISDMMKMQNSYAEQTGRAINFSMADNTKSAAMGQIMGDDQFANIAASMEIFNVSVSQSADIMWDMYKGAAKMGLSQSKLSKNVLSNMKMAERYLFKGGVKGYVEMAKLAESMRVSMSAVAATLGKIQEGGLEGIIKTSAQLQVLGGNFAMGADPLAMVYESFNDPQALEKRFQGMMKGMGTMNTKTGEVTFNMADSLHLQQMAKTLGRSTEDVMNEARAVAKVGTLKQVNKNLDEEQLMGVANQAHKNAKGEWVVNTIGGEEMKVSDINNENISQILADTNEDRMEQYAKESLNAEQRIQAAAEFCAALLGGQTYTAYLDKIDKQTELSKESMKENLQTISDTVKAVWADSLESMEKQLSEIKDLFKKYCESQGIIQSSEKTSELTKLLEENDNLRKDERLKIYGETLKEIYSGDTDVDKTLYKYVQTLARQGNWLNGKKSVSNAANDYGELYEKLSDKDRKKVDAQVQKISEGVGRLTSINTPTYTTISPTTGTSYSHTDYSNIRNFAQNVIDDGFANGNGVSPMAVAASNVVPVHDGFAKIAKTDPNDTAIFARTGGPFDTLFNEVFKKIDQIYNVATAPISPIIEPITVDTSVTVMPSNNMANDIRLRELALSKATGNDNNQQQPIVVRFEGTINLNANGQNIDILQLMKNDPTFIKSITSLITRQIEENKNGGRASNFSIPYYNR